MLLLSRPTNHPKLKTPSTPSLPSFAKVSESRTPSITVNLCMSSDENPSSARPSLTAKKPYFQKPTGRTRNRCSLCKRTGHYRPTCTVPPALLAEPEPLAIMATFARNAVKDCHHPDVHPRTPTVSPSLNMTTMMMLLRDFIKKRLNTILTLDPHRAR